MDARVLNYDETMREPMIKEIWNFLRGDWNFFPTCSKHAEAVQCWSETMKNDESLKIKS